MGKFVIIQSANVNNAMQRTSKMLGIDNVPLPNIYFKSFVTLVQTKAKEYSYGTEVPDRVILKSFIDDIAAPTCYLFLNTAQGRPKVAPLAYLWVHEIIQFDLKGNVKITYSRPPELNGKRAEKICQGMVALIRKLSNDPTVDLNSAYKTIQQAYEVANGGVI